MNTIYDHTHHIILPLPDFEPGNVLRIREDLIMVEFADITTGFKSLPAKLDAGLPLFYHVFSPGCSRSEPLAWDTFRFQTTPLVVITVDEPITVDVTDHIIDLLSFVPNFTAFAYNPQFHRFNSFYSFTRFNRTFLRRLLRAQWLVQQAELALFTVHHHTHTTHKKARAPKKCVHENGYVGLHTLTQALTTSTVSRHLKMRILWHFHVLSQLVSDNTQLYLSGLTCRRVKENKFWLLGASRQARTSRPLGFYTSRSPFWLQPKYVSKAAMSPKNSINVPSLTNSANSPVNMTPEKASEEILAEEAVPDDTVQDGTLNSTSLDGALKDVICGASPPGETASKKPACGDGSESVLISVRDLVCDEGKAPQVTTARIPVALAPEVLLEHLTDATIRRGLSERFTILESIHAVRCPACQQAINERAAQMGHDPGFKSVEFQENGRTLLKLFPNPDYFQSVADMAAAELLMSDMVELRHLTDAALEEAISARFDADNHTFHCEDIVLRGQESTRATPPQNAALQATALEAAPLEDAELEVVALEVTTLSAPLQELEDAVRNHIAPKKIGAILAKLTDKEIENHLDKVLLAVYQADDEQEADEILGYLPVFGGAPVAPEVKAEVTDANKIGSGENGIEGLPSQIGANTAESKHIDCETTETFLVGCSDSSMPQEDFPQKNQDAYHDAYQGNYQHTCGNSDDDAYNERYQNGLQCGDREDYDQGCSQASCSQPDEEIDYSNRCSEDAHPPCFQ